tara:strand:- start:5979 stop:6977 length:999 start_codon:yes stop_codon:yes gene_type:complete
MSFVKESEYKKYIQDNFMNQASTKHLENQTNIDTINDDNISKTHEEIIEIGIKNETQLLDFTYIDNETLSNLVEYERDYFKDYKMHLCLYKIDMTLRLPFVKYFLKKENNYVFPSKQVEMRNMIDSISRNTDNNIDSIFYNQIEELYQSVTNTNLVKEKYRGFLENNNNDIFVFIDISEELFDLNDEYEYLIIDEILNTKMVKNVDIDINIVELFKKYVFLQRLKTIEGIKVQFPKIGYICKSKTDGGYENILKQDEESVLLLYPKVEFEKSNKAFLFSSIPLSVENMNLLFRFACFIENFEGEENMDNEIFEENEIQYYMLKNTDLFTVLN